MTTLVLGTVGAAVGGFIGGPVGAQIGWLAGSMLGSLIDPPKMQGPRLGDLKLQRSSYGSMIPIVFGTVRLAGTCIDQTDLQEHSETTSGKGGPEVENFTYSASFALALCEGPIIGVRKIWADGRLIYSGEAADDMPCTLYLGTEDQLPDPTFEAIHGVGEVPGYRGIAYAVFSDYFLTDYGNRIPLLEFEVYTAAGGIPWRVSTFDPWPEDTSNVNNNAHYADGVITTGFFGNYPATKYYQHQFSLDGTEIGTGTEQSVPTAYIAGIRSTVRQRAGVAVLQDPPGSEGSPEPYAWYVGAEPSYGIRAASPNGTQSIYQDDYAYGLSGSTIYRFPMPGGVPDPRSSTADASFALGSIGSQSEVSLGTSNDGHVWVALYSSKKLWKLDADLNVVHFWDVGDWDAVALYNLGNYNFHVYKDMICYTRGSSTARLTRVNGDFTFTVVGEIACSNGAMITLGGGLVLTYDGVISLDPPPASANLGDIVEAISARTSAGAVDVAELTDNVRGFAIASQMTARNAIQILRQGFGFDAVESDDLIKFRKRDGTSIATIPDAELGAHEYGNEPPELLKTIRKQEAELPRTVTVTYIDQSLDYQTGAQHSPRQVTGSEADVTLELPIVFTAAEALSRAWIVQMGEWIERETFEWSLDRKWSRLEPCDIVNVRGRVIRITNRNETPAGVITFRGVLSAPSIYTQPSYGSETPAGEGTPNQPAPAGPAAATSLLLLDLPLITDGDYPNGPYAAVYPTTNGAWSGATVYKSSDGGSTYASVGSSATSDVVGTVATALGNFGGGNLFDEANTISVVLGYGGGTLTSATEEALLNGANVCAIGTVATGWEVLQYRTATLTAPNTYTLQGLLRGRRGTEWRMSTHGANETFVRLPTTININGTYAELGLSRKYKPVSFGGTVATALAQDFTNTGVAIKPLAPVALGGGRDASGNVTFRWTPRRRGSGGWPNGVDLPATDPENWQVEIYSDGTYTTSVRATGVTVTTLDYTAAQQTADFGSPQATIYWRVAQLGGTSLGYFTRATT